MVDPNSYSIDPNFYCESYPGWYYTMWYLFYGFYAVSIAVWLVLGIYGIALIRCISRSNESMAKSLEAMSRSLEQHCQK